MSTREEQTVALLESAWGRPVRLSSWRPVEPWSVALATVRVGTRNEPVVAKWVRTGTVDHPEVRVHPGQTTREHATLRFLSDRVGPLGPEPIACADDLLIMEDLRPRVPLHDLLLTDPDEPGLRGLEEMVDLLATLHTASHGRADEYATYLPSGWSTCRPPVHDPAGGDDAARSHAPDVLDVPGLGYRAGSAPRPAPDAVVELEDLARRLVAPGEFSALSNGDPGPNNLLIASGHRARLIDFELGGYQHALTDLVTLYLPHPAWVTATDPVGTGLERRYRERMARSIPAFADEAAFGWELSAAALAYALGRLRRFEVCDDRPPGHPSRLQLVVTTEAAAALARGRSAYPAIVGWLGAVGTALRARWPDADLDTSALPDWLPRM